MRELTCDILVVGGGLGGVAAALSAARMGKTVIVTEETDWLGGQLTSQAVPMDEHPWMDQFGSTATYRRLRSRIRAYYKRNYPLTAAARWEERFTPGAALTTHLSCEPAVALSAIMELLAPFRATGQLSVLERCKPDAVERDGSVIRSVVFRDLAENSRVAIHAPFVLDATETGELLPLAGMEYTIGTESVSETNEPHAVEGPADPQNMQAFTFCFAVAYRPGEDHTIDRPSDYDFWRDYQAPFETGKHLSWNPRPRRAHTYEFFPTKGSEKFSLWQYRRILYPGNFEPGYLTGGVSLINSSHNDYWMGSIIDVPDEEVQLHLERARQLSLSTLYWLQTDAPRPDGGLGYPELAILPDYTGTRDGLAKAPYIREGRRIHAHTLVTENHVGLDALGDRTTATPFNDSVGVGCYNIDLHPTTGGQGSLNLKTRPFQIPLGALLPKDSDNYIAAGKNIGVTHLTNGCYRLHSIEWNIGEASGALAAHCLRTGKTPVSVREDPASLEAFQRDLARLGVELSWPDVSVGTSYYSSVRDIPDWNWGEYDRKERWSF